jgi:hypothetical protein
MKSFYNNVKTLIYLFILLFSGGFAFPQSTWDMVGMRRSEVIESLGSGISGADNSLVYVGPANQYTVSTAWTFYFNSRDKVKKVIFTTLHRTKVLAKMQSVSMKNELESNGFECISENKYSNGERTVTLSFRSDNGLHALYTTSY